MDERDSLAHRFEESRTHLRRVAYRMLGSLAEADDAVQEAWIRLSRSDTSDVLNLRGWLTTVVGRVCLDMLRSRRSRREEALAEQVPEAIDGRAAVAGPEQEALLADAVGPALLLVLDSLGPAERLAFVLHDMFAVPFDEIAHIVGRTEEATRQLASRARRRVKGGVPDPEPEPDPGGLGAKPRSGGKPVGGLGAKPRSGGKPPVRRSGPGPDRIAKDRQRAVVAAFLAASRDGDFEGLLAVLVPEVVCRADGAAVASGASAEVRGARAVAEFFKGRARAAQLVLVDGAPGLAWMPGGQARVVFTFVLEGGRIASIDLLADPARVGALSLVPLQG